MINGLTQRYPQLKSTEKHIPPQEVYGNNTSQHTTFPQNDGE